MRESLVLPCTVRRKTFAWLAAFYSIKAFRSASWLKLYGWLIHFFIYTILSFPVNCTVYKQAFTLDYTLHQRILNDLARRSRGRMIWLLAHPLPLPRQY